MVTEPSEWLKIRITGRVLKKFRLKDLVLKLVSLIFMSIHFSRVEGKKLYPIGYRSINWTQWFQNVQGGEWAPKMMMPTPPPPTSPTLLWVWNKNTWRTQEIRRISCVEGIKERTQERWCAQLLRYSCDVIIPLKSL